MRDVLMDLQYIIPSSLLVLAVLNFILQYYINKSKFSQKDKYAFLIITEIIFLIFFGAILIGTFSATNNIIGSDRTFSSIDSILSFPTHITIDDMNNLKGWNVEPRDGASGTFGLAEVRCRTGTLLLPTTHTGIQIKYNLGANTSFIISKKRGLCVLGENINNVDEIGLYFIANGSTNSIDLELTDQDGKCFGKKWRYVTGEEKFTYLGAKLSDFKCCNCNDGNETVDLSKVVAYSIAISDEAGEEGGAGVVTIDWIWGDF